MNVHNNILSSLLGNCLLTAKTYITLYMYVTFCMMFFFTSSFFTAENENLDEVFTEVTTCKRIMSGFFCKVNQLILQKIEKVILPIHRLLYLICFHVVFFQNSRIDEEKLILLDNQR